ncbi:MAG: nuclear transport factor 2 family protein [Rhodobacteraceae bacterium]|nr:nuclear transport factor 2 family protein [Paracoccaceae bacterium]
MHDLSFFLELEARVWQALKHGDTETDAALLDEAFLGVYCTGFVGRDEHTGQLSGGATVADYTLTDARLLPLGPGRALLAYRAEFLRTGQTTPEAMYVSSIWEQRGGHWRNTFSQDTAEGGPAPV